MSPHFLSELDDKQLFCCINWGLNSVGLPSNSQKIDVNVQTQFNAMEQLPQVNFDLAVLFVGSNPTRRLFNRIALNTVRDSIILWQGQIASWPHNTASRQFSLWLLVHLFEAHIICTYNCVFVSKCEHLI